MRSGGDGIVAGEGLFDIVGGDGAETADAPVIATEFDDSGRHDGVGFAGIEDQRKTIAQLVKDFTSTGAGGGVRNIGAGAGEGHTDFGDEIGDDARLGPTQGDAAGVGGNLEGQAVGSVDDNG